MKRGMLDCMESIEKISLDQPTYQRLVEIAIAADAYLLRQTPETLDDLRDAVLAPTLND